MVRAGHRRRSPGSNVGGALIVLALVALGAGALVAVLAMQPAGEDEATTPSRRPTQRAEPSAPSAAGETADATPPAPAGEPAKPEGPEEVAPWPGRRPPLFRNRPARSITGALADRRTSNRL